MSIIEICHMAKTGGGIKSYVNGFVKYLMKKNIPVIVVGYDPEKNINSNKYIEIFHDDNRWAYIINLFLKAPFLHINKDDVLHFYRPDDVLPFTIFFSKNTKILRLPGLIYENISKKHSLFVSKIYSLIETLSLRLLINQPGSIIVAVDERTKISYEKRHAFLIGKIVVIPNGVDIEMFKPMEKRKCRRKFNFQYSDRLVGYVGRIEKEKNVEFLIKSFYLLLQRMPMTKLVIAGEGREKDNISNLINEMGINKNVELMSHISHEKIPNLLNCFDILGLCSLYEGSPNIIREALSCGTPVVSLDVGDIGKIISNMIMIVKEKDEGKFAKAMFNMINNNFYNKKEDIENTRKNLDCEKKFNELISLIFEK